MGFILYSIYCTVLKVIHVSSTGKLFWYLWKGRRVEHKQLGTTEASRTVTGSNFFRQASTSGGLKFPDIFENGYFLLRFQKKYASTRSVFESFSAVHAKTLNYGITIASLREHASCFGRWCITSSYPSTRKREVSVFKNLYSGERF